MALGMLSNEICLMSCQMLVFEQFTAQHMVLLECGWCGRGWARLAVGRPRLWPYAYPQCAAEALQYATAAAALIVCSPAIQTGARSLSVQGLAIQIHHGVCIKPLPGH